MNSKLYLVNKHAEQLAETATYVDRIVELEAHLAATVAVLTAKQKQKLGLVEADSNE